MRIKCFLLIVGAALLVLPNTGVTQQRDRGSRGDRGSGGPPGGFGGGAPGGFGGGDRGSFGGGGRSMGNFDPSQLFNMMSGGKDVVVRSQMDPNMVRMFDRTAERMGVTNGQITREQFTTYMQQRMSGAPGAPPAAPGAAPSAAPGTPPAGAPAPGGGFNSPEAINGWAESMFRRMDANGDGVLNYDEMSESLRAERDKWDTNKDGFIDLTEFKAYFQARMAQMQSDRSQAGSGGPGGGPIPVIEPVEEEEKKPVVYRAGTVPKDLAWFAELDTDGDGQVGLYEWKAARKPIDDFLKMDRNNDGFLTVEEVLYYQSVVVAKNSSGSSPGGPLAMAGPTGGFGAMPGGGGNPWMNRGGAGGMPGGGGNPWANRGGGGGMPGTGGMPAFGGRGAGSDGGSSGRPDFSRGPRGGSGGSDQGSGGSRDRGGRGGRGR